MFYLKSGSVRTHTCFLSSQTARSLPHGETQRQLTDFPVSSSLFSGGDGRATSLSPPSSDFTNNWSSQAMMTNLSLNTRLAIIDDIF